MTWYTGITQQYIKSDNGYCDAESHLIFLYLVKHRDGRDRLMLVTSIYLVLDHPGTLIICGSVKSIYRIYHPPSIIHSFPRNSQSLPAHFHSTSSCRAKRANQWGMFDAITKASHHNNSIEWVNEGESLEIDMMIRQSTLQTAGILLFVGGCVWYLWSP